MTTPATRSENRRRLLALGGLVGLLAVGGGAVWAATALLGTGAQPAEALPAGTLGYVSIDLDPSGGQKVEAIQTLRRFPAFEDEIGLETDDDLRKRLFEELVESGECEGLDYGRDVEPWLGDRAAVGAIDLGDDAPAPVLVVQVTDADAAADGLDNLVETCGARSGESGGWAIEGDWVVYAETENTADEVVDAAREGSLADDDDFVRWTEEAGEPGIVTIYVAPEAGEFLGRHLEDMAGMGAVLGLSSTGDMERDPEPGESPSIPPEVRQGLDEFDGAAATMRFNDGSLELEMAGGGSQTGATLLSRDGGDGVAELPDDTMAAFGVGLADGWFDAMLDQVATSTGESPDELLAMITDATGLELPADAETLLGEGVTVSLGGAFDPEAAFNGGPAEVPAGLVIEGDPAEIESVLDKIRPLLGHEASLLDTESDDDSVFLSPNADYRAALAEGGDLGDSAVYRAVTEGADGAGVVAFVNFDAGGNWLDVLAGEDPDVAANLEPLSGFGIVGWRDGDVSHSVLRLTTD